ncbi:hypothetical protein F4779DRAFT_284947 [Xylariaceae sp. FL0662B]|nr:hypothetical protein F4779DRAFT_284947 [Xylariaceae sp. FL0662B]
MGQIQSVIVRCLKWIFPPALPDNSESAFMELPLDIILLIYDSFLDPASRAALALTCKDMFSAFSSKSLLPRLDAPDLEELLLLLERDLSGTQTRYYCHECVELHSFDLTREGPTANYHHGSLEPGDCRLNRLYLSGSAFSIGYAHVRVVMNRHFYGAPRGLAGNTLDNVNCSGYEPPYWFQKWSARIIDDELFLSATHTLRFRGAERDFRDILDQREYQICAHTVTRKDDSIGQHERPDMRQQQLHEHQDRPVQITGDIPVDRGWFPPWTISRTVNAFRSEGSTSPAPRSKRLRQCRDILDSCIFCATDYVTTLEKRKVGHWWKRGRDEWTLTIVTYHQLGSCRSPSDPKWVAFTTDFWCNPKPDRETFGLLPGDVKKKWEGVI